MKDIGESFREKREEFGISKEEAANDMEITLAQLDNLEDGNANAFKDVFFLKEIIRKYSKYLNLDEEENINKFNDFIFDYTSRIPIDEILQQTREISFQENEKGENKISSPYTLKQNNRNTKKIILYFVMIVSIIVLILFLIKYLISRSQEKTNDNFISEGRYII